jgi:hypothetical protein
MFGDKSQGKQPFWIDDPYPYSSARKNKNGFLSQALRLFQLAVYVAILIICIFAAIRFPPLWFLAIFQLGFVIIKIFPWQRYANNRISRAETVQQAAREKTGASLIGSAIHTAGHPLLQVNQPIVLALIDSELRFYSYTNPIPLDTLDTKDLLSIDTIIYDDDRIPHIGIVDNTAQALQLSFLRNGIKCTCLFRRMYKVRPIEWYQAIQATRVLSS